MNAICIGGPADGQTVARSDLWKDDAPFISAAVYTGDGKRHWYNYRDGAFYYEGDAASEPKLDLKVYRPGIMQWTKEMIDEASGSGWSLEELMKNEMVFGLGGWGMYHDNQVAPNRQQGRDDGNAK